MPLLKLETSVSVPEEKRTALSQELSRLVAETLGKPEQYVMVTISRTDILMAGQAGEAAFADLRSIGGLGGETNRKLTAGICQVLEKTLHLRPERVYVTFSNIRASDWGWNRATFG
jgi:phenylpyruvate tautomerase